MKYQNICSSIHFWQSIAIAKKKVSQTCKIGSRAKRFWAAREPNASGRLASQVLLGGSRAKKNPPQKIYQNITQILSFIFRMGTVR